MNGYNRELPYVMSIEGGFGSGKTYFITRFCEYIRDNGINTIYLNCESCDYKIDPIFHIVKEVMRFF
jgi:chromosomal replication initiation ATPase DnaA